MRVRDFLLRGAALLSGTVVLGVSACSARPVSMRPAAVQSAPIVTAPAASSATSAPVVGYTVVHSYPGDPTCFVEGFQWSGNGFYESCGLYGQSTVREVSLTGRVRRTQPLLGSQFAEGLVRIGSHLYQLTWKEGVVIVRDAATLRQTAMRPLPSAITEGWGMTTDGRSLITSDGSPNVRWLDPDTLAVQRTVVVHDGGVEQRNVNELELIDGTLWANVWQTDRLLEIDPASGDVVRVVDLQGLRPAATAANPDAVLNGIAYDPVGKRIFVTGKTWGRVFEIRVGS